MNAKAQSYMMPNQTYVQRVVGNRLNSYKHFSLPFYYYLLVLLFC